MGRNVITSKTLATLFFLAICLVLPALAEEAEPKRIVSLGPSITEQLYLLGCAEKIVGVTVYCERPSDAKKKTRIGTVLQPDIEKVVSQKPDLVLATPLTNLKAVAKLRQLGLRVDAFPSSRNFDDLCDQFVNLARLVGKEKEAEQIVSTSRAKAAAIRVNAGRSYRPKVFVELGAQPLFTANKDYFINDFIELAGGVNIAANSKGGLYSLEKVIEENPDVILITLMGIDGEREKNSWQRFQTISAVKKNRIYLIDSYKSCSPNPVTFVETLEEIVELLRFCDSNNE